VVANVLLSCEAVWFTAHGYGPFAGGSPDLDLVMAQTFVGVVALTALLTAAVTTEREQAQSALADSERMSAELRASEARLAEAQGRLRALMDNAPMMISLRDTKGRLLELNAPFAELFGGSVESILAQPGAQRYARQAGPLVVEYERQALEQGRAVSYEMPVEHPDGSLHEYYITKFPVTDGSGTITGVGGISLDISARREAEQLSHGLLESAPDAMVIVDDVGAIALANARTETLFGYTREELIPAARREQHAAHRAQFAEHPDTRPMGAELELSARGKDGHEFPVEISLSPVQTPNGRLVCASVRDITGRRRAAEQLRLAEERFRGAFEHAPIGISLCDLDGRYLQVNQALCEITGYSREELCGTTWQAITHPDDGEADRELMASLVSGAGEHPRREKRYLRASGEPVWVSLHAAVLRDSDGRPQQLLSQVVDITERRQLEKQLRHLADHDPLTGLLNRRGLEAELDAHVARVNRYGARGALLVLDLDHFKTVNDTLGHNAGDELIISVAGLLARRLRESDTIARLGGDEFAVLLPQAGESDARAVADAIVADVRENAVLLGGQQPRRVTASVGVTLFRQGLAGAEDALVDADLAMYDAKEAGRDRAALYASDRHDLPRMKARLAWVERIRAAMEEDRFVFHAQPILDLGTDEVRQYELLLRMLDESGDAIPPASFLYIAERFDLIQELDRWVVGKAVSLIELHQALGEELTLEVNLSGKSLGDRQLLDLVRRELDRSGIAPGSLIFEVTETAAVANIHQAREFAEQLTELGCRFALDDFGAGFGSFYYLKHIPFDYLKIDGEFITRCLGNRTDQLVIASLVSIARGLNKRTIAERVEDEETLQFLREQGVDFAQGYHVGRPRPFVQALTPRR
jgi:diguanylate cyclase (GGDEF)-like protein/PAS domain S-box-containing protein